MYHNKKDNFWLEALIPQLIDQSNILSNQNEDHNDFMNMLPKYVALKLQSDILK